MKLKNRFFSIMLSLVLVVSNLYLAPTAFAVDGTSITNGDGIQLTKKATRHTDKLNTWDIDIKLEFTPEIQSQDIVLIVDSSGSMDNNKRLANAKVAAKSFVDIILDDSEFTHKNRIALISFSTGVTENASFRTDRSSLKNDIDALSASGGTFTQLALNEARTLLQSSTADNKIIVLLTDGQPTFGFGLSAQGTAKYEAGLATGTTSSSNRTYRDSIITRSSSGVYSLSNDTSVGVNNRALIMNFTNASVEKGLIASDFNYARGSGSNMGGSGSESLKIQRKVSTTRPYELDMLDLFHTNIAEANIAKNAGNTLYTIALDLGNVNRAEATLQEMASSTAHYFEASSSQLSEKFTEIANKIRFPFTNMSLLDPMGTGFEIVGDITMIEGNSTGLSHTNSLISWDMTSTSFTYKKSTNKYVAAFKYTVVATEDVITPYEASGRTTVHTNGDAKFYYTKDGVAKNTLLPKPTVKPTILLVKKVLLDSEENELSLIDASNQRKYEYTLLDDTRGSVEDDISTETHDIYILQHLGAKSIEETSIVNDNIERFIRSTKLQKESDAGYGTLLENGVFTLAPESGINTLRLINKIDDNYIADLGLNKDVSEITGKTVAEKGDTLEYEITIVNQSGGYLRDVHIQDTLEDIKDYLNTSNHPMIIYRNGVESYTGTISELMAGYTSNLSKDETYVIKFKVDILTDVEVPERLENTVTVNHLSDSALMLVGESIISSTKAVKDFNENGFAEPGEVLNYTITIKNTGTAFKKNLFVQDTLSELLPHIDSITTSKVKVNGVERPLQDLIDGFMINVSANSTVSLEFAVVVKSDLITKEVTKLHNIATVGEDTPEVEIETGDPDINIIKSFRDENGDGIAEAGESITFTILVRNDGKVGKEDALLQDTLTDLLPYIKDVTDLDMTTPSGTAKLKELMDGMYIDVDAAGSYTVSFVVEIRDDFDSTVVKKLRNLATVDDLPAEVEVPTGKAIIITSKTVSDENNNGIAEAKERLTFTITIENQGNVSARNILVRDTLEDLLPYIDSVSGLVATTTAGDLAIENLMSGYNLTLGAEHTYTITFTVKVKDIFDSDLVSKLRNFATIGDQTPEVEIPTGKPKISATKSVRDSNSNDLAEKGEVLHYTLTINNSGEVKDTVFVQDDLSLLMDHIQDISSATFTINGNTKPLSELVAGFMLAIDADETFTITFSVKVKDDLDASVVKELKNIATVGENHPETEIETGEPRLVSSKVGVDANGNGFIEPNEALHYTITIRNDGNVDLRDVLVQDLFTDIQDYFKDFDSTVVTTTYVGEGSDERSIQELIDGYTVELKAKKEIRISFTLVLKDNIVVDEVTMIRNVAIINDQTPDTEIPTGDSKIRSLKSVRDTTGDDLAEKGEVLYYTITIENYGKVLRKGLFIQDKLTDLVDHVNDLSSATFDMNGTTKDIQELIDGFYTDIDAGETITLSFALTVKDDFDASSITTLYNIATVGDETPDVEIPTGEYIIDADKTVVDASEDGYAEKGETLHYTLTITNSGTVRKDELFVQDTLSDLLPHIKDPSALTMLVNGVEKDLSDLMNGMTITVLPKETITIEFSLTVKDDFDASMNPTLRNMATVGDETPDVEIPTGEPDIHADKSVLDGNEDGYAEKGETLWYTITIENRGKVAKKDLLIQDTLSDLLPHIDDISTEVMAFGSEERPLQDLVDGITMDLDALSDITIRFKVRVKDSFDAKAVTALRNMVTVGDETPDVEIPTGYRNLVIEKSVTDSNENGYAEASETLAYSITIENTGNLTEATVHIQDTLDKLLPHIDDISELEMLIVRNYDDPEKRLLKDLVDGFTVEMAPEDLINIYFTVKVRDDFDALQVERLDNLATANDKEAEATITTGKAMLLVNKSVTDASNNKKAAPGEILSYRIEVLNYGNVDRKGVLVKDTLSELLPYIEDIQGVNMTIDGKTYSLESLTRGVRIDLNAGQKAIIEFDVQVKETTKDIDSLVNIVTADDEDARAEIEFEKLPDRGILPLTGAPSLALNAGILLTALGALLVAVGKRKEEE